MYIEEMIREFNGLLFNEKSYDSFCVDVFEIKNGYQIVAEIPGVKKEDILIEFKDGILYVAAEKRIDTNQRFLLKERSNKKYRRTFSLGEIDDDSIVARYEDGLLILNLYFKQEEKSEKKTIIVE